jgi:hypothetical protein
MDDLLRPKSSYEKINYSLRPAKNIERKMFCEAITRLSLIQNLDKYRYIGFGSTYFTDFVLLHKLFGITDLISIEKDKFNKDRFEFNKPYSCIDMIFENSHDALTKITNWGKPCILWLDYDQRLDSNMLDDIRTFFSSASAGSMFIVTVSVKPDDFDTSGDGELINTENKTINQIRLEKFKNRFLSARLPYEIDELTLGASEFPKITYKMIDNEIIDARDKRNGGLPKNKQLHYKQIFHFLYNDGTLMLTVGGLLYNDALQNKVDEMKFKSLDFVREKEDPFFIEVPRLTYKEIRVLDSLLPKKTNSQNKISFKKKKREIKKPPLNDEDIKNYSKIYRYFPSFAESNL